MVSIGVIRYPTLPYSHLNDTALFTVTVYDTTLESEQGSLKVLDHNKNTPIIVKHLCGQENYTQNYQLFVENVEGKPANWPKGSRKDDHYINEEGMFEILVLSQQVLAKGLAEYLGIKIIGYQYVCKGTSTIYTIQKIFEGIPVNRQISIGSHRIDLCFSEHKLATTILIIILMQMILSLK